MNCKINAAISSNGLIDIFSSDGLGWRGLRFYIISGGRKFTAESGAMLECASEKATWEGLLDDQIKLRLEVRSSATGRSKTVRAEIINEGSFDFQFERYGFCVENLELSQMLHGGPVYAHSGNLRCEDLPNCRAEFPFIRQVPLNAVDVGTQSSSPAPVLFWGEAGGRVWLMEGSLTQDRHFETWRIGMSQTNPGKVESSSEYKWSGGNSETVNAGSRVALETGVYGIFESAPDGLYKPYIDELTSVYEFQGPKSRLDKEPVFCTWNYNIFTNVNEEDCLKRMDAVKEIQGKGFFQLDHGYQPQLSKAPAPFKGITGEENTPATPELDAYFPNAENAWDLSRFPSGPEGFVSACKERGLRPSIWWSPRVAKEGQIFRERRNWILEDENGLPVDCGGYFCLDLSVQDVWDFLEYCARTITKDWGFEGMKLDFYSWMFDHPGAFFRNGGTGIELKWKFIKMLRSYLGPDGYFLHCISCPLGNPFLAIEGFDSFRAGIDIHSGEWSYHVRSVAWLLPLILSSGKKTWFASIDSCMGKPEIPAIEQRSRLALAYITGGMLEFSGPVELLDERARADYGIMVARCDQGGEVFCPDEQAFYGRPLPNILIREHRPDSLTCKEYNISRTIAFFNWEDNRKAVSFSLAEINVKNAVLHDFWSKKRIEIQDNIIVADLPPHGHLMLDFVNCITEN